jgi:hypothetical protein
MKEYQYSEGILIAPARLGLTQRDRDYPDTERESGEAADSARCLRRERVSFSLSHTPHALFVSLSLSMWVCFSVYPEQPRSRNHSLSISLTHPLHSPPRRRGGPPIFFPYPSAAPSPPLSSPMGLLGWAALPPLLSRSFAPPTLLLGEPLPLPWVYPGRLVKRTGGQCRRELPAGCGLPQLRVRGTRAPLAVTTVLRHPSSFPGAGRRTRRLWTRVDEEDER